MNLRQHFHILLNTLGIVWIDLFEYAKIGANYTVWAIYREKKYYSGSEDKFCIAYNALIMQQQWIYTMNTRQSRFSGENK